MDGYYQQQPGTKQAMETIDYRLSLIISLEDITRLRVEYQMMNAKLSENKEVTRKFICAMVTVMEHLLPKLEGGGEKWKPLLDDFEKFRSWSDNILIPMNDTEELKKAHELFRLIVKAYDVLGLSNY